MNFHRQVCNTLDTEHRNSLELLGRIEQAFARAPRAGAGRDPGIAQLAPAFARLIEHDIVRHFDFEERDLFPLLAEAGDGNIALLLTEEHDAMRSVAQEILPLIRSAAAATLSDADFNVLRRGALEMVERQVSHIQKETMALLPLLDDLIDDAADGELGLAYASS